MVRGKVRRKIGRTEGKFEGNSWWRTDSGKGKLGDNWNFYKDVKRGIGFLERSVRFPFFRNDKKMDYLG